MTLAVDGDHLELDLDVHRTLADALDETRGAISTYRDCVDGTCGACTVVVDDEATRSCLMLAVQCDGADVRTVAGLAVDHPLRAALCAETTGECGVCIPGLVMLTAAALARDPDLINDPQRLGRLLAGNECRRTSHRAVQQAVIRAATG